MASIDLAAQQLMETIYDESMRAFDGLKSATEQTIKVSAEEARRRLDSLLGEASAECGALGKSTDKEAKKMAANIIKGYSQTVSDVERDAIQSINDTWRNAKIKLNTVVDEAKNVLGKQVKELEKVLKDITKSVDRLIGDYTKLVRDYAKAAQNNLTELNKQYVK